LQNRLKKKYFSHLSYEKKKNQEVTKQLQPELNILGTQCICRERNSSLTCPNLAAKSLSWVCHWKIYKGAEQGEISHSSPAEKRWPVNHSPVVWGLNGTYLGWSSALVCWLWVQNRCSCFL